MNAPLAFKMKLGIQCTAHNMRPVLFQSQVTRIIMVIIAVQKDMADMEKISLLDFHTTTVQLWIKEAKFSYFGYIVQGWSVNISNNVGKRRSFRLCFEKSP